MEELQIGLIDKRKEVALSEGHDKLPCITSF
jgi:hypothetical protein